MIGWDNAPIPHAAGLPSSRRVSTVEFRVCLKFGRGAGRPSVGLCPATVIPGSLELLGGGEASLWICLLDLHLENKERACTIRCNMLI